MHLQFRTLAAAILLLGVSGNPLLAQRSAPTPPAQTEQQGFRGVRNMVITTQVANGYRTHQVRPDLNFNPGEEIHFYGEPVGFGLQSRNGRLILNLGVTVEIVDSSGNVAHTSPGQINGDFEANSTGIYVRLSQRAPNIAPGSYAFRVIFRDNFTTRTVRNERTITINPSGGSQPPPPVARPSRPQPPVPPQAQAPTRPTPPPPQRRTDGITVANVQFSEAPATGHRQFTARRNNVFANGEQFNIYFEMANFRTRFDGTHIRGSFNVDIAVFAENGQVIARQDAAWKLPLAIAATEDGPVQGVFAALSNSLTAAPGNYRIVLRVNDEVGGTSTEVTLTLTIGTPSQPPQAQLPPPPAAPQPPQAQAPQAPPAAPVPGSPRTEVRIPFEELLRPRQ